MKIMKCDICGAEMDSWADVRIEHKFSPQNRDTRVTCIAKTKIENKEVCADCYKKIMQMFDKSEVK